MIRLAAGLAGALLLAACDDPRAPKVKDEPAVEVNEDELRGEGREAGRSIGEGARELGDEAERAGERVAPEGDRR